MFVLNLESTIPDADTGNVEQKRYQMGSETTAFFLTYRFDEEGAVESASVEQTNYRNSLWRKNYDGENAEAEATEDFRKIAQALESNGDLVNLSDFVVTPSKAKPKRTTTKKQPAEDAETPTEESAEAEA